MSIVLLAFLGPFLAIMLLTVRNAYVLTRVGQNISKKPDETARYIMLYYQNWKKITLYWMLIPAVALLGIILVFKAGKVFTATLGAYLITSLLMIYTKRTYESQRRLTFSFLPKLLKKVGIPQALIPFFKERCLDEPANFRTKFYQLLMLLPTEEAYALLKLGARDADENIRLISVDMLAKHFPTKIPIFLPDFLRDTSPLVKMSALENILLSTDKDFASRMVKELLADDQSLLVRQAAQQAEVKLAGSNTLDIIKNLKTQFVKDGVDAKIWIFLEELYKSSSWKIHKLLSALFTPQNQYFIKEYFGSCLKKHSPEEVLLALVDFATYLKTPAALEALIVVASESTDEVTHYIAGSLSKVSYSKYKNLINSILSETDLTAFALKNAALEILIHSYPQAIKGTNDEADVQALFAALLNSPTKDVRNKAITFFERYADENHAPTILSILKKTKDYEYSLQLLRLLASKMKIYQTNSLFTSLANRIQNTEAENEFRQYVINTFLVIKENDPAQRGGAHQTLCTKCYARGVEEKVFAQCSYIVCRKCKQTQSLVPCSAPVVGLVSQNEKTMITQNTARIQLWNHTERKASTADINELEIGYFEKANDLEWAVSAVITTLQNEQSTQTFKIRTQPEVNLSENIKRVLDL